MRSFRRLQVWPHFKKQKTRSCIVSVARSPPGLVQFGGSSHLHDFILCVQSLYIASGDPNDFEITFHFGATFGINFVALGSFFAALYVRFFVCGLC